MRPEDTLPEAVPPSEAPASHEDETGTHPAEVESEPNESAGAAPSDAPKSPNMHWYCVKVQSGREETIKEAIERRVKIEGLEEFFGQIVIPTEKVTEITKGKRVTREKKKLPGYFMAQVEFNDAILYLFRETSGVGDFVGGSVNRKPTPMTPQEVSRWLDAPADTSDRVHVVTPQYVPGDRVKIKDDTFKDMEGEVKELIEEKNLVRVEVVVLGRPVSVELEYWQVEPV
jgi:transcriptional antiterminator NusG